MDEDEEMQLAIALSLSAAEASKPSMRRQRSQSFDGHSFKFVFPNALPQHSILNPSGGINRSLSDAVHSDRRREDFEPQPPLIVNPPDPAPEQPGNLMRQLALDNKRHQQQRRNSSPLKAPLLEAPADKKQKEKNLAEAMQRLQLARNKFKSSSPQPSSLVAPRPRIRSRSRSASPNPLPALANSPSKAKLQQLTKEQDAREREAISDHRKPQRRSLEPLKAPRTSVEKKKTEIRRLNRRSVHRAQARTPPTRSARAAGGSGNSEHDKNVKSVVVARGRRSKSKTPPKNSSVAPPRVVHTPPSDRKRNRPDQVVRVQPTPNVAPARNNNQRGGGGGGNMQQQQQLRDVSIDPDNMSYEQLLEWEEKQGKVVSPAAGPSIISQLPSFPFKHSSAKHNDNSSCSICLEEFKEGISVTLLPCFHTFHTNEITDWLSRKSTCPMCMTDIKHQM